MSRSWVCILTISFFMTGRPGLDAAHAATDAGSAAPAAQLQDVRVSIIGGVATLGSVIKAIEHQTPFTVVYMNDQVTLGDTLTLERSTLSLESVLERLARRFHLAINRINERIVMKRATEIHPALIRLSGIVRDRSTNEPLVYANLQIEGAHQGTTTDANGRYTLEIMPGVYTIGCSFVGYKSESFHLAAETDAELNCALTATDVVLQDVTVFAHRVEDGGQSEVNALTLQSETIKHVTSLIPDVMRSVQMLPGVSTNNEFSSKFNVRGGNQDENLVIVNGTQVYDPFHVKEIPNASIGIFNADMIRKMDLVTGGFTARYGDKLSSVLNIEYREGRRDRYAGMASLSLMDVNALAEGPMGANGSFIIGARKSYFEYVMKLVDAGPFVHPSFYDVQGVFAYAPAPGSKFLLKLIHSNDDFTQDPHRAVDPTMQWVSGNDGRGGHFTNTQQSSDTLDSGASYNSEMAALQFTQILSPDAVLRAELSLYDERENENSWSQYLYAYTGISPHTTYFYNSTREYQYTNALAIRTIEMNLSLDLQPAAWYGIKTGASVQRINYAQDLLNRQTIDEYTNEYAFPDTTLSHRIENVVDDVQQGITTHSFKTAAFIENAVQLTDRLLVNAGVRMDYFDLNKDLTWSPRLNCSFNAGAGIVLRAAWGHYYQAPVYRQIAYSEASDTNTQSQHAVHLVLGVNYDLNLDHSTDRFLRFKVEGFRKRYDRLITASVTSQGVVNYTRKNDATGTASGVDMQVIYSAPGFYGWISYGYLFARQTSLVDGVPATFPRYTDQRHTLALTGEFDLGRQWSINGRFAYGSGYPYTPEQAAVDPVKRIWIWVASPVPNSDYLPAYTRVDVKVTKGFSFFGSETSVFLDVSNLFNATNIQSYRYRFSSTGQPYREDVKLWPILPSMGMAIHF